MKKKICYCTQCNADWEDKGEDCCPECGSTLIMEECSDILYMDYEQKLAKIEELEDG